MVCGNCYETTPIPPCCKSTAPQCGTWRRNQMDTSTMRSPPSCFPTLSSLLPTSSYPPASQPTTTLPAGRHWAVLAVFCSMLWKEGLRLVGCWVAREEMLRRQISHEQEEVFRFEVQTLNKQNNQHSTFVLLWISSSSNEELLQKAQL